VAVYFVFVCEEEKRHLVDLMERHLSTKKYLIAFVLTIIIFAGGIGIGILFENARLNYSEQTLLSQKVNLQSLQLQQRYVGSGLADCQAMNHILENNIDELTKKMAEVIDYQKGALLNGNEFNLQLQDYFLTEIEFLLLAQDIDQKCEKNGIKMVFFYDDNPLETQGEILAYLKKIFQDRLLVFSLNSQFKQEPLIGVLLTSHNITTFPAVVVDEKVFQGHQSVETLTAELCTRFKGMKEVPEGCEGR